MSACAVMLVKDEEDVIEPVVAHLLRQVDHVIVADNLSTDGTRAILEQLAADTGRVEVRDDPEVGYWQSRKTTALALEAWERGFNWVVPCDADEVWLSPDGRRLGDYLDGLGQDVMLVEGLVFAHYPTGLDRQDLADPLVRMGWRKREWNMRKVACRTGPDLVIEMGNHDARRAGKAIRAGGIVVRHFSARSEEQYLRKIRNGEAAYLATDLPEDVGVGWRWFVGRPDEAVRSYFNQVFYFENPWNDDSMIFDPAPVPGAQEKAPHNPDWPDPAAPSEPSVDDYKGTWG